MPKTWLLFLSSMATSINMFGLLAQHAGEHGTNRVVNNPSRVVLAPASLGLLPVRARFLENGVFKARGKLWTSQIL